MKERFKSTAAKLENHKLNTHATRYLVVGVFTNLVDLFAFQALVLLKVHYLIAQTLVTPVVLALNYSLHRRITFRSKSQKKSEITKYLLNALFLYVFGLISLYIMVDKSQVSEFNAKLLVLLTNPFINYFALKKLVYATSK